MMRDDPVKHVFIWPAVLIVLLVSIFPLIYSLTTSFMSFRLVPPTPPRFVGLDNRLHLPVQAHGAVRPRPRAVRRGCCGTPGLALRCAWGQFRHG
jgi:hypothetical protein